MSDDIVRRFLSLARDLHPETPTAEWTRLEVRLRQEFGGERVYVLKAQAEGKAFLHAESLAAGKSQDEARREVGVHRTTVWRWRQRRWVYAY